MRHFKRKNSDGMLLMVQTSPHELKILHTSELVSIGFIKSQQKRREWSKVKEVRCLTLLRNQLGLLVM